MIEKDAKVLFEDNNRKIMKVIHSDGSRSYKVKEMQKNCFYCNSCYISLMKMVKLIKTGDK